MVGNNVDCRRALHDIIPGNVVLTLTIKLFFDCIVSIDTITGYIIFICRLNLTNVNDDDPQFILMEDFSVVVFSFWFEIDLVYFENGFEIEFSKDA
jgi:hypothetical protein